MDALADALTFTTNINQLKVLLVAGISGCGKSTLYKAMIKMGIGQGYLGIGKRLRSLNGGNHALSTIIETFTGRGEQVPLNIMEPLIREWVMEIMGHRLIFSDGFPRNPEQVPLAVELFRSAGYEMRFLFIHTDENAAAHNLVEQAHLSDEARDDGSESAIAMRIGEFETKVLPMVTLLKEIVGEGNWQEFNNTNMVLDRPEVVIPLLRSLGIVG